MNYWQDVEPITKEASIIKVVVEIPKGSSLKYEVEPNGNYLTVIREVYKKNKYPFNYGFVPRTLGGDSDPLDVVILGEEPIEPLTIVECQLLGVLKTLDNGERDDKLIAIPLYAKNLPKKNYKTGLKQISKFLKNYKRNVQNKDNSKVFGVDSLEEALQIVKIATLEYKVKFDTKKQKEYVRVG